MIGRKEEKQYLQSLLEENEPQFVAVYGRRRIGKTYLVRESFNHQFFFQHTGLSNNSIPLRERKRAQLDKFEQSLKDAGYDPGKHLSSWEDAFGELKHFISGSDEKKKVIFIDELSWMDTKNSGFVSALESFWNGFVTARREKDVVLIVCASATYWIMDNIVNSKGGLHNRLTGTIRLNQFTLKECEEYASKKGLRLPRHQIVNLYMVMGGVALYWSLLEKGLSVSQNIDALFFGKNAQLKGEFNELYDALFKKPEPYKKIITALSRKMDGMTKAEIRKEGKISDGGVLSDRLRELEECGFIISSRSFHKAKKDTTYKLIDNYTIFYFKYVKDNEKTEHFWTKPIDSDSIRIWSGLAFERVCMQHIPQLKQAMGIAAVASTEYAWRSDSKKKRTEDEDGAQIDLLIERGDGVINICEMKWSSGEFTITKKDDAELRNKVEVFQYQTGTKSAIMLTMITAFGVKHNMYYDTIQSEITIDQMFV